MTEQTKVTRGLSIGVVYIDRDAGTQLQEAFMFDDIEPGEATELLDGLRGIAKKYEEFRNDNK